MQNGDFINFGYAFQLKVLASLLSDKLFLAQSVSVIDEKYFENESVRWILGKTKSYYKDYNKLPTLDVFKTEISSIEDKTLKGEVLLNLKKSWDEIQAPDLQYVKDKTINFCRNQELKKAIYDAVEFVKKENYDAIPAVINKALMVGLDNNVGHDYRVDFQERYAKDIRFVKPMPWDALNDITSGGLGRGELGCVVAASGAGKSWFLSAIGAHGVKEGLTVLHYTLELNELYTARRYDTVLTGISPENLEGFKDKVEEIVNKLPGKLIVKDYDASPHVTISSLRAHLERLALLDVHPDMIIVDYADLLTGSSDVKRLELDEIYKDLRKLAGEFQCPLWTASQANRSSLEHDVVEAGSIAESYNKVMISDLIFSLSRKTEDKMAKTGRLHIIKNRFGVDGLTFPVRMDIPAGIVDVYKEGSKKGKEVQQVISNHDTLLRKKLKEKYDDLF